jgi:hypothetical protein
MMLKTQLKEYGLIIAIVTVYCAMAFYFRTTIDFVADSDEAVLSLADRIIDKVKLVGMLVFFILVTLILRIMFIDRPKRLTKQIIHDFYYIWVRPPFLFRGLLMLGIFYLFIMAFSTMKTLIPYFHPYGELDKIFYEIDKAIHFGVSPWKWTHAVFGTAFLTFVINIFYNLWFFILYVIFILNAFINTNIVKRQTYFLSFFLCWIINGTFFAILMSSVGPCYYDLLYNLETGPFTSLMNRLENFHESYPIWALATQDLLWEKYSSGQMFIGGGISAMPSLHVSTALLHVFVGYSVNKFCGRLLLAFFFMILLGSVHLGWHYAIDGYFSILATIFIWYGSRWVVLKMTDNKAAIKP